MMNRGRRFRVARIGCLLLGLVGCNVPSAHRDIEGQASPTNYQLDPAARGQQWREDIDALVSELPRRHKNAFFRARREDFEAAATALREDVPRLADHEVVVGLMKLAAMLGDSHTTIGTGDVKPPFRTFPIRLHIFRDGPVVVAAGETHRDLIGARLLRFDGLPVDEAFRRVSVVSAYENEPTYKSSVSRLLVVVEIAHALGLTESLGRVSVSVRDVHGVERVVELTPLERHDTVAGPTPDDTQLPLARRRHPNRNWFECLPDSRTIYVHYGTCENEPERTVAQLTQQILERVDAGSAQRLVLDLRGNGGGDSSLIRPLIRGLRRRPPFRKPGGVIVLIDRNTFSSAYLNALEFKQTLRAILIGEPTGQKPNAYGEVRAFVLPNSRLPVRYSTKFWQTVPGDPASLEPDVLIEPTSTDYLSMRDPVLDAALAYRP